MGKSIRKSSSDTRVGLDLAKKVFRVRAVDPNGEVVVAHKLARGKLVGFFSELPRCVVAMEACPSAHHWGRQLLAQEVAYQRQSMAIGDGPPASSPFTQSRAKEVLRF